MTDLETAACLFFETILREGYVDIGHANFMIKVDIGIGTATATDAAAAVPLNAKIQRAMDLAKGTAARLRAEGSALQ